MHSERAKISIQLAGQFRHYAYWLDTANLDYLIAVLELHSTSIVLFCTSTKYQPYQFSGGLKPHERIQGDSKKGPLSSLFLDSKQNLCAIVTQT